MVQQIQEKNSQFSVVVYSKSTCPYCARAKSLFKDLGVEAKVVELDNMGALPSACLAGPRGASCCRVRRR